MAAAKRKQNPNNVKSKRAHVEVAPPLPFPDAIARRQFGRPDIDPQHETVKQILLFQLLSVEETSNEVICQQLNYPQVLVLYGVTDVGQSIAVFVAGFRSYFYFPVTKQFDENDVSVCRDILGAKFPDAKSLEIQLVQRIPLMYYRNHDAHRYTAFLHISFDSASHMSQIAKYLEDGELASFLATDKLYDRQSYESNVVYWLRFMIDTNLVGGCWVELPAGSYSTIKFDSHQECQGQFICSSDVIISHYKSLSNNIIEADDLKWSKLASGLTTMTIAVHTVHDDSGEQGERIGVISNVINTMNSKQTVVFALRSRQSTTKMTSMFISLTDHVFLFDESQEAEMLMTWRVFFLQVNADVITGYEAVSHLLDILERSDSLKLGESFALLGRDSNIRATIRSSQLYNAHWVRSQRRMAATSNHEFKTINLPGRVVLDLRLIIERQEKLRTYSFADVCAVFFMHPKEVLTTQTLTQLFRDGSVSSYTRVLEYAVRDVLLTHRLFEQTAALPSHIEMARVCGINIEDILFKGQMLRFWSLLCRHGRSKGIVIPAIRKNDAGMTSGPINFAPEAGYSTDSPLAILDFSSLYPSIIIAHNLCFTTLILPTEKHRLLPEQYEQTQTVSGNFAFVKSTVKKGILPEILELLLAERKRVKLLMAQTNEKMLKDVLNGRQLALKLCANASYGFVGAAQSKLQCLPIAESTITRGADMLIAIKDYIDGEFGRAEGVRVVYGDTDSLFVRFEGSPPSLAIARGKQLAAIVTDMFPSPIRLEFQKVLFPYILVQRKRYAGLEWTDPAGPSRIEVKGLENTSRGSCGVLIGLMDDVLRALFFQLNVPPRGEPASVVHVTREMRENAIESAIKVAQDVIRKLLSNGYDLSELIMTKGLWLGTDSDQYKAKQAHVALVERVRERDESRAFENGERLSFVFVKGQAQAKGYEKSEEPLHVLKHGLQIDLQHYYQHQIREPLSRVFSLFLHENAINDLLSGEHTRVIADGTTVHHTALDDHNDTSSSSSSSKPKAITSFFRQTPAKTTSCLGCRVRVPAHEPICALCAPQKRDILLGLNESMSRVENQAAKLASECGRCQGNLYREFKCCNGECCVFYRRAQVMMEVAKIQAALAQVPDW